jgi:hypothetical protein
MTKRCLVLLLFVGLSSATDVYAQGRWTPERAAEWRKQVGWLAGANYIPATAINQLEMWQADSWDPKTIDRELGWAESVGFNSMRVFLHDLLWQQDSAGLLKRMEQFLQIAEKHRIGVLFVFLDGVWDPQPELGKQRAPKPRLHNSGWVQSPGSAILGDPTRHDELKPFVQGVLRHFGKDKRVHGWDLFNEPDNTNNTAYGKVELKNKREMAMVMLRKVFAWAREVNPAQPLTVGMWIDRDWADPANMTPVARYALDNSDVISFHAYSKPDEVKARIDFLKQFNRPILCTEYLARGFGNTIQDVLPILKANDVGAYIWGLVDGKTQTIYPWVSWEQAFTAEPKPWHHDIFRADGKPYSEEEIKVIRSITGAKRER